MTVQIPFTKMVGTGNDFIVVDARQRASSPRLHWPAVSRALCDRRHGIGADGLLVLEPSAAASVKMRVINPDGSEAQMCGNGARCVALLVKNGAGNRRVTIETLAGVVSAEVRGERVAMRMTDPTDIRLGLAVEVGGRPVRCDVVNTGVPHAVVRVDALDEVDVNRLGRALRFHRQFSPRGTNVDFIESDPKRPNRLRVRTYERGVEGETLACGTGVSAAAVIQALRQRGERRARPCRIKVETRSGDFLSVSMIIELPRVTDVILEGPAARVFDGTIRWPMTRSNT